MEQGLFGSSESLSLLVRVLFAEPYSASSFGEKLDKMNLHLTPRQDGPGMPCFELHIPMPTFRDGVWGWFGGSKYLSEEVRRSRCRVRQTCRNAVLVERKFRSAHGLQKAPITWQLFARYAGKNFLTHALLLRDLNKTGSFRSKCLYRLVSESSA